MKEAKGDARFSDRGKAPRSGPWQTLVPIPAWLPTYRLTWLIATSYHKMESIDVSLFNREYLLSFV